MTAPWSPHKPCAECARLMSADDAHRRCQRCRRRAATRITPPGNWRRRVRALAAEIARRATRPPA